MTKEFPTDLLIDSIRRVHGDSQEFLPLHAPVFGQTAIKYTNECIDTGWVSSAGAYVSKFEEMLCEFTGAKRATAVVNGTAALHVALMLSGVQSNDEVLVPSLTFVATANAIHYCNAIPHFIEVEDQTLGICAERLAEHLKNISERGQDGLFNKQTGRRISALVGMHAFGHPFEINSIMEVCDQFELPLVEDAAESIGSYVSGRHTGTFGKLGILSFNGNKTITTGGGGAILTDDDEIADKAKHITTTAKRPHAYEYIHDVIGFNYRMPNINAALGCSQLEDLPAILQSKKELAESYQKEFSTFDALDFLTQPEGCTSNYWLNAVILKPEYSEQLDEILVALNEAKLLCRPIWNPLHLLDIYSECPKSNLDCTEQLAKRVINIPSSPKLG